jgi:hypothetical protein
MVKVSDAKNKIRFNQKKKIDIFGVRMAGKLRILRRSRVL